MKFVSRSFVPGPPFPWYSKIGFVMTSELLCIVLETHLIKNVLFVNIFIAQPK